MSLTGYKNIFSSKTVWGGLVALAAGVATLFGVDVDAGTQQELTELATGLASSVGGVIAIIGRIVATTRLNS